MPDCEEVKVHTVGLQYNFVEAAYPGQVKTFEFIQRDFYWPKIRDFINEQTCSCNVNEHARASKSKPAAYPLRAVRL